MSARVNTRKRVLIIVGVVALACTLLSMGAVAIGGAVYALTRGHDWLGRWKEQVSLALPARAAAGDDKRGVIAALEAEDDEQGIVIGAVLEDSAAATAGLERGDILLELDGAAVNSPRELLDALDALEPGDEVELRVLHGDDVRRLTATLEERDGKTFLGVVPCCVIREPSVTSRVPEPIPVTGALITEVMDDSPASSAGLEEGDVVLAVDAEELGDELTLADAIRAHQPGDRVTLRVQSPATEEEEQLTVELGEHPDLEGVAYLGVSYLTSPSTRWLPYGRPPVPHFDGPPMGPDAERYREVIPEGLPRTTVIEVEADSPAEEAGLREGDVILSIDDEKVNTPQDVVWAVTAQDPGDDLTLTILRPGEDDDEDEELELLITLGEHPEDEARAYLGVRLGFGGVHLRRFGGEWDSEGWHWDFDLPEDWNLPFDLDELPHHFEFEFSPEGRLYDREFLPGADGV
jgi:S1-C subfamily serine protease